MSFDITLRNTSWGSRLFIEASAGTGKTFLIEHFLVRSALFHGLQLEELALITFTRAVANELKVRLRRTFEKAAGTLLAQEQSYDYLSPLLEGDVTERKRAIRLLENGRASLSKAVITTIHGFCDKLLMEYAESSQESVEEEWLSDYDKREWLVDYLREQTTLSEAEWQFVAKSVSFDQKVLLDRLLPMLEAPSPLPQADSLSSVIDRLQAIAGRVAGALSQKALSFRGNTRRDGSLRDDVKSYFLSLERLLVDGISEERLRPLFGWSLPSLFSVPLARSHPLSDEEEMIASTVLNEVWPALQLYVDKEMLLKRLETDAAKAFLGFLQSSGKKTPDSLLLKVLQLSDTQLFRRFAAQRIKWLIVDEFQDTDATQWAIFSKLFLDNPEWDGHVLFVGDPKQAIYGFRKADVYSYMEARQRLQETVATLSVNFRSTHQMVEAQNQLFFGEAATALFYLPKIKKSLDVVQNRAVTGAEFFIEGRRAIHFPIFEGSLGKKRRWPHEEIEEEVASWIADEMISLYDKGIPFNQQAILVKDRYQAKRIKEGLLSRKIPVSPWRLDPLTESPIIEWLSLAFRLAESPQDKKRLSQLLLLFPSERHHALCHAISSEHRLDLQASCALEWKRVRDAFYRDGIGGFARALFQCRFDGSHSLHEWLLSLDEGYILDLEQAIDLLSRLPLPLSLEAYERAIENLGAYFSNEPEALFRRTDPNDSAAPILTMHRSKGLEFDVVYAIGAFCRTPLQETMDVEEADAEKMRQLYVAVTRAKKQCYLPLLLEMDGKSVPCGQAAPLELALACHHVTTGKKEVGSLYEAIKPAILREVVGRFSMVTSNAPEKRGLVSKSVRKEQPSSAWPALSYTTRSYRSFSQGRAKSPGFIPVPRASSTSFGIQFHAAIAKALVGEQSNDAFVQQALSVRLPIHGEEVPLCTIPSETMRIESSFLDLDVSGQFFRGTLDLLFIWKNEVFILDWKTNVLPDGISTHDYLLEHGYDTQYALYRTAAERAFGSEYPFGAFFFVFVRYLDIPQRGIVVWK